MLNTCYRIFVKRLNRAVRWMVIWVVAFSVADAAEARYVVRRGDTLYGIARKSGIPLDQLAQRNGLSKNYHVYVGQRLVIPVKNASKPTTGKKPLPAAVQRAIDRAAVKPGRWKRIVIHHSAVDSGTMKGMDRYHREERRMESGLAYHFVIGNGHGMGEGEIGVSSRWTKQLNGGHLASESQNTTSLGICLVGNFDKRKPTAKQMERLTALVQALMKRCRLPASAVGTHQQVNIVHTRCPGRHFPTSSWLKSL